MDNGHVRKRVNCFMQRGMAKMVSNVDRVFMETKIWRAECVAPWHVEMSFCNLFVSQKKETYSGCNEEILGTHYPVFGCVRFGNSLRVAVGICVCGPFDRRWQMCNGVNQRRRYFFQKKKSSVMRLCNERRYIGICRHEFVKFLIWTN